MHARTLILTALVSGPVLGTLAGFAIDPTMQPRPEPAWRHSGQAAAIVPTEADYTFDQPQDLSPYGAYPRALLLARRFAADADSYQPPAFAPAVEEATPYADAAAQAADEASRAAASAEPSGADAGLVPVTPEAPPEAAPPEPEKPAIVL